MHGRFKTKIKKPTERCSVGTKVLLGLCLGFDGVDMDEATVVAAT
jgi:hypothetical protein